ncbi:ribonuclease Y [Ruficoccus sp. ZRK36]|uniref:ribonuclease Y n=1 Tax=Ruficoccus sp. ZRK36 TaxID=2866311 RepID=UPI001C72AA42|nr:ribonuclease Y [Ruficoccus sp. ZRK36]QYY36081.1 ribonuclease Y [Ruficoccus sp. ZRK36]
MFSWEIFIALFIGAIIAVVFDWTVARIWLGSVREKAHDILEHARKEAELSARETLNDAHLNFEKERVEREAVLQERRQKILREEEELQERRREVDRARQRLSHQEAEIEKIRTDAQSEQARYENLADNYQTLLKRIADISNEEAKELLREEARTQAEGEIRQIKREMILNSEEEAREEANRILVDVMQRMTSTPSHELSATIIDIPNEEMKGRIIGREGRNIKAFERATGVTLMIDETPGSILVSSFDPVRREVARLALEHLIRDGRIHPVSIEETVERVEREMADHVIQLGEDALVKLRMGGVHPEVVRLIGKLNYRLSNNQNTLEHSIEVAFLCSLLASELGLDPDIAKRCGLFHDIGKAIDHEYEGSHAVSASRLLQRHGEEATVVNAVACSHGEVDATSVYAGLLKVADSLSATRPGVRTDSMDGYVQRVKALEDIALSFEGVAEAYAVQAGREIRIIVCPDQVDDIQARSLVRTVRQRVEDELQYPGSIKITLVREQRFTETAK